MVNNTSENEFELYTLAELSYENHFKESVKDRGLLYPEKWYSIRNYRKKIKIIAESLDKDILIKDTLGYKDLVSCIE